MRLALGNDTFVEGNAIVGAGPLDSNYYVWLEGQHVPMQVTGEARDNVVAYLWKDATVSPVAPVDVVGTITEAKVEQFQDLTARLRKEGHNVFATDLEGLVMACLA